MKPNIKGNKVEIQLNETQLLFIMEFMGEVFSYGLSEADYPILFGSPKSVFVDFVRTYRSSLEDVGIEY